MQTTANSKQHLTYELKALGKYLYKGGVSANWLGLSYVQANEELLNFRAWLLGGKGEFLEDKLLKLLRLRAGQVKMQRAIKAFTPVVNLLLFRRVEVSEVLAKKRRALIRTIPIVVIIMLYGFLKASGRLSRSDKPSPRTIKSSIFIYKLCKEMEEDFEDILGMLQGHVAADLPKLMFVSVNTSPARHTKKLTKRGFPPSVVWLLKKYMEVREYDQEYN